MRWSRRDGPAPRREAQPVDVEFLEFGPDGSQRWVAANAEQLDGRPHASWAALYLFGHDPGHDSAPPPPATWWPEPPTTAVSPTALTCIRLNCDEEGRPTAEPRCPRCGHTTQLLRNSRWPRRTG